MNKKKNNRCEEIVLVFDCGATNLKVIAINSEGNSVAQANQINRPKNQKGGKPDWFIWDLEEIWFKLCKSSKEVLKKISSKNIKAVTVTTWGADGSPVKRDGTLTYPPISWQCPRTEKTAINIKKIMSPLQFFKISGYQFTPFNTLFRLIWLRNNVPKALDNAYTWLMMPGLIVHRLTGNFHIEPTSASTMMAMCLPKRDWSSRLLKIAGLEPNFFPEWSEPGQIIGYINDKAEKQCKIPSGVPVIAGGHDTQFALFGSGAKMNEAVLSSGTWEILGIRSNTINLNRSSFRDGLIFEADAQEGFYNPQLLMMGSGVLEWLLKLVLPESGAEKYDILLEEAKNVSEGSEGIMFVPSFVKETGPTKKYGIMGTILGLTLRTSRKQILRSSLEGLSYQLRYALNILSKKAGINISGIRVVGGGAKNSLWNQIRADVTGIPVTITEQKEYAALGAALIAFIGIDRYRSMKDAIENICFKKIVYEPSESKNIYNKSYRSYLKTIKNLKRSYS
jgi:L-fuculokinase